ncbi:hypothetical protein [Streptomyces sp. Je 1-369]|uniref:hypothetical protein n=1 Tax=Streptomyces sp. Je 1-369 TaxID=2966192 RepID=UPI0022854459|nr:hypothetical protein [Streptomyces sp. Je 1-369]WAL95504.1 hypothetical protein NOO62_13985 [Streptomyces sp. Je 1-369]
MSHTQPGPYGGQQSGPYGQQPQPQSGYGYPQQGAYSYLQQPGPYGQPSQAPYGQQPQAPYGQVPPPPPPQGGGKKKTGLVIGGVTVVAAIAVGAYFVLGAGGGTTEVKDDGAHKLVLPASVGAYEKSSSGSADGGPVGANDKEKAAALGVQNAKQVGGSYMSGSLANAKRMGFNGLYGKIDDPEQAIDNGFDNAHKDAAKGGDDNVGDSEKITWVGSPETVEPGGLDNAIMKCQTAEMKKGDKTAHLPICVWADHSTYGVVFGVDMAAMQKESGGMAQDDVAEFAADLRKAARTKA